MQQPGTKWWRSWLAFSISQHNTEMLGVLAEETWKQQRNVGPAGAEEQWPAAAGVEEAMELNVKMKSEQWTLASEIAILSAKPSSSSQIRRSDNCEDANGVGALRGF